MKLFNSKNTTTLGQRGEQLASNYLKRHGYKILEMNFKNDFGRRLGEIDIIAKKGDCFIFVEVKTRLASNETLVLPEENINRNKLHKLTKIINYYVKKHNLWNETYRIDAISILIDPKTDSFKLNHIENIFF